MSKIFRYILLAAVLVSTFTFVSCEKEVTIDLNSSEPRIVIEGLVQLDTLAYVRITKSKDYNADGGFPAVTGAIVTLSDNAGNKEILAQDIRGLYAARTMKGVKGRTYNLVVEVEDQVFTSTSAMPDYVGIDSVYMDYYPVFKEAYPMVQFKDIAGQANYYRHTLSVNGKRVKIANGDVTDDKDRDGRVIDQIMYVEENNLEKDKIEKGDTITTSLLCLDKGAYTFFESMSRMDMTLTNPTSNIKGGALGYFSAFTKATKTVIAEWDE